MKIIRKALIAAAGFGTRFLPITKTIQKEMLPVLNRPTIDYLVEDCIKAGIEEIIFVISEHNSQILHFYRENKRLEQYLLRRGKQNLYERIVPLHQKVHFSFVRQPDDSLYGTAVPVSLAREHLQNEEAFLVFMGDDFIYNHNGASETAAMIETFHHAKATALTTCLPKDEELLHKYGIAEIEAENGFTYLKRLVEKPATGTAPSNLANISKYILTPVVFEMIDQQQADPTSGEFYITDTINNIAAENKVVIHTPQGEYLDGGDVLGWLQANLTVAGNVPELRAEIEKFLAKNWGLNK